jgi:hypothetical protein
MHTGWRASNAQRDDCEEYGRKDALYGRHVIEPHCAAKCHVEGSHKSAPRRRLDLQNGASSNFIMDLEK